MLSLLDPHPSTERASDPIISGDSGCVRCLGHRPLPKLDGSLLVDPEIHLPSPGMDLDVAYYYNSASQYNGPFGAGRTISPNILLQASASLVTITRGDGSLTTYVQGGGGSGFGVQAVMTYESETPGNLNALVKDTDTGEWTESSPGGVQTGFPSVPTGQIASVTYVQDPVGNLHTFSYSAGKLSTIQDVAGRKVSFSYNGSSLLEGIQDWAGRRTTFAYDTASVPGKPLLTTLIGPTGCQTLYRYDGTGLLKEIIDPNGYSTSYLYDGQNRVTERRVAGAGITTFSYLTGKMVMQDPQGALTTNTVDAHYALLARVDPNGVAVTFTRNANLQELTRLDPLGRIVTSAYDASGNLTTVINPFGHRTSISYDAYNNPLIVTYPDGAVVQNVWGYGGSPFDTTGAKRRLQAVVDPLGKRTSYTYNSRGQVLTEQNPLGYVTTHNYDSLGNRIGTTDAQGYATSWTYDAAGNVIRMYSGPRPLCVTIVVDPVALPLSTADALGNTTTYGYDSVGNRVLQVDPLGYRTTWTYNVFDKPATVQDALGNVTSHLYDSSGRHIATIDPLGRISTKVYDLAGHVIATVQPSGIRATTLYDALNNPYVSIDPAGFRTTTVFDAMRRAIASENPLGLRTSTTYDAASRPVASIQPTGAVSTTVYDLAGRATEQIDPYGIRFTSLYDAAGQMTGTLDALGNRTTMTYDRRGALLSRTDETGRTTTTIYDGEGRPWASQDPAGYLSTTIYDEGGRAYAFQDALGFRTTVSFDAAGRRIASIDELGYVSTTVYDALGRAIAQVDPLGRRSTSLYDASGAFLASVDALGFRSTTVFDAFGRAEAGLNALGHRTTTVFDPFGRAQASIDARGYRTTTLFDTYGRAAAEQDALGFRWTTLYDELGRVTGSQDPLGYRTTTIFDQARSIAEVDARGFRTTPVYDLLGRVEATEDALGRRSTTVFDPAGRVKAEVNASGYLRTYLYDSRGNLETRVNPLGYRTTSVFDALSRESVRQDALGQRTTLGYDPRGLLTSTTDAKGQTNTFSFDQARQHTGTLFANAARVTQTFDAVGQATSVLDSNGRWTRTYDALGRMLTEVGPQFPLGQPVTSAYDPNGNRISLSSWRGRETFTFDARNQNVGMLDIEGGIASWTYDARRMLTRQDNPNETRATFTYDADGRTTQIRHSDSANTELDRAFYSYDPVGNPSYKETIDGFSTYTYDAQGQLKSEQNPKMGLVTWSYDAANRRITQSASAGVTTYTFDQADQLTLAEAGSARTTYSYDQNGNTASVIAPSGVTTYTWDPSNRLTGILKPTGARFTHTYRFDDLRHQKQKGTGVEVALWDSGQNDDVLAIAGVSGVAPTEYFAQGERLVRALGVRKSGNAFSVSSRTAVHASGSLSVDWTAPTGRPTTDKVALFKVGEPNSSPVWSQTTGGGTSGTISLTAPSTIGSYEFRYLTEGSETAAAVSAKVVVATAGTYAIGSNKLTVDEGESITVSWAAPNSRPSNDWVALYPAGAPNDNSYVWWQFTGGAASGAINLTAPADGDYEFRYLDIGYTSYAQSDEVTVIEPPVAFTLSASPNAANVSTGLSVSWTAATGRASTDWVALYPLGAPNDNSYVWSQGTIGQASGSFNPTAPSTPGWYEFRYMQGYVSRTKSNPVWISAANAYALGGSPLREDTGGTVKASWTAPSGSSATDWIGLFRVGETVVANWISYQYTGGATSGSVTMAAAQDPGYYEFRYFLNDGSSEAVRSNQFAIGSDVDRTYHADALGTIEVLSKRNQRAETNYLLDAWGNPILGHGLDNPLVYVGEEGYLYDPDTGLYYVRARWLDPKTGRWLSRDPIGFDGGDWNLYGYVGNMPSTSRDRSGLFPIPDWCAIAEAFGLDRGHTGGVICVGGLPIPCSWPSNFGPNYPPTAPSMVCISACTIAHEKMHIPVTPCPPTGLCRPLSPTPTPELEECKGYQVGLSCALTTENACCGKLTGVAGRQCYEQMQRFICFNCRMARAKCQAAGKGDHGFTQECRKRCPGY